ncbi:serine/threonine protein kinase [Lysinibacillus sp. HST-98]|uniref:serine/threonine-protein kinase n=1 Tax=Lysinibacillus sp. HST-98 TaxID=2800419 RepID=UPI001925A837|nr:serine/threonine-protein kinase [Lysinibacillus sp. HST-98]MBL3728932.1 serine/threonine protein kinase [Lysinibacillus sp. HST-98]
MLTVDTMLKLEYRENIGQEGRNSEVNIAYDPQLNAELVVKKISKSEFTKVEDYFLEAQMLYATEHPNIMGVRYATQDDNYIYIAMEYYKNGSLNSLIDKRYLTVNEIVKYSLEFLSGIHYMHTKELIHFDIKPTNILISNSNKAVVTDFGLAKYLNEHGFAQPDKLYPLHMPPETFKTGKFSFYTDVYQIGLTLYRMCNGNKIFYEQFEESRELLDQQIIEGKFPKKNHYLPHIPDKLQKIITKALTNDETLRYESILDLINAISTIEDDLNWSYNECGNTHSVYQYEDDNFVYSLEIKLDGSHWITEGYKVKKKDNTKTRVNKWNTKGHKSKDEVFKQVKRLLNA